MCKTKWKRILYEDQGFPDNYVDDSFLKSRKTIVWTYQLKTVINSSHVLLLQTCIVCSFVLIWIFMSEGSLVLSIVLGSCIPVSAMSCLMFAVHSYLQKTTNFFTIIKGLRIVFLLLIYTALASPILQTLTHTISTDTVCTMTVIMLLGHLIFHEYGSTGIPVSRSLSLNMAVFAAVCLASRLETTAHTFATIVSALQLFGLWPMVFRRMAGKNHLLLKFVTIFLFTGIFVILVIRNLLIGTAFFCIGLSITIILPLILISLQPQKDNIYGPWDEAVLSN